MAHITSPFRVDTTRWGVRVLAGIAGTCLAVTSFVAPADAATPKTHPSALKATSPFDSLTWGDPIADLVALSLLGGNTPSADPGSLYTVEKAIGARNAWTLTDAYKRQITGQGVAVALLDSGTASVAGLNGTGKLTYGPDLSIEGNGVLTNQDTFGHGTHMAGIIAGRDTATLNSATAINSLSPSVQLGIAPDARLVSLKLATTDGSTDVSQVIAALNWVTEHQTSQDGTKIRVVNLSFGTQSLQPYQLDPLAAAAENAWRHGLVVVVSGGNQGQSAGLLDDPAIDPYVVAVGASDSVETVNGWTKPSVATFSSSGSSTRHVDLLAPGTSIASLRAAGSFVDVNHPLGRVTGDTTGRLFRGSGTSQAAAVVSGAVALMLQANPSLTPDQVKYLLTLTATPVSASAQNAGAGQINVLTAVGSAQRMTSTQLSSLPRQGFALSNGSGSIDAARGGYSLVDPTGAPITGEIDVQGNPWNAKAWWSAASTLKSWSGGVWMGNTWTGSGWLPRTTGVPATWAGARWSGARWSSASWDGARWSGARWSGARWSGARWSDLYWS